MNDFTNPTEMSEVQCCIAGGGPAGIMLGLLLARGGVEVLVLEKHADFLRDFRGDTIHPSTLEVIHELGLLDKLLKRPHQKVARLDAQVGDATFTVADFSHLPTRCKFIAMMPQWDFLNFLTEEAKAYPTFHVRMEAEVTGLIYADGRVTGVHAKTPQGTLQVRAQLAVGADGRSSTVRDQASLEMDDLGASIDVLWMRISKRPEDPGQSLGRFDAGSVLVMIDRADYWQCAFVIPKGGFEPLRQRGLPAFRDNLARLVPVLRERFDELSDWNSIKTLTVRMDRLRRWHQPGLLCIGDAAHAMSPIGGVGINVAIQDAVAAANVLAVPLRQHALRREHLEAIQKRRELPTRLTQGVQILIQNRVIRRVLGSSRRAAPPMPLRLLGRWPFLRRIPGRLIGVGFRPEHVATFPVGPA
jgi:2-polyprenyl-6-methoxyphenol hydroxylase-like FAD-dependent oxidoreductase